MGLFSRKEAKSSRRTAHRPRPSVSSEAQAASLRVRARRRLAGAVALVLAAVIVLPMLLDAEPRPVPAGIEIAVPERQAPFNPSLNPPPATDDAFPSDGSGEGATRAGITEASVGNVDVPTTDLTAAEQKQAAKPEVTPETKPDTKPESQAENKAPAPVQAQTETKPAASTATPARDQTAEALAILEGRKPAAAPAAPATGAYVLQVASYGTDSDAKARLDQLKSQGVSNAYVEPATVNGKQTFRLRVGPFDSRAAAQAAQTRLRTLGYDNGFITTK